MAYVVQCIVWQCFEEAPDFVRINKDGLFEILFGRLTETTIRLDRNRSGVIVINRWDNEGATVQYFSY